jgi:hypothetical protein
VLVGNEIKLGMVDTDDQISDKEYIARQKELGTTFIVHTITIMSTLFTNRRVTYLRFVDAFEWIWNIGGNIGQHMDCFEKYRNCFGVNHRIFFWRNIRIMQGGICQNVC